MNNKRGIFNGILKLLTYTILFFLIVFAIAIVTIQIPYVQIRLVHKATDYLSKTLNFPVKIGGVDIDWFDQLVLENVSIDDPHGGKMIFLKEVEVDFIIVKLLQAQFQIEQVTLSNGSVNLIKYKDASLNIDDFITAIQGMVPKKEKKSEPSPFTVPYVKLDNMSFSFSDTRKPKIKYFDHNHFVLENINGDVFNLKAIRDTFRIDVRKLTTNETATGLKVHELNTDYVITKDKMEFNDLEARIGNTVVKDYLCFHFSKINDLAFFNDKIKVVSRLKSSVVDLQDLAYFAPDLFPYHDKATISGNFKGRVVDFGVKNLDFSFGRYSNFKGTLELKGLPELNETFIQFVYQDLYVHSTDLKQYSTPSAFEVFQKFKYFKGQGNFTGFASDFVTHGKTATAIGRLETDINLKINEHKKPQSYYKGHLKTSNFNFGHLIDKSSLLGLLDMDGEIEGNGFHLSDANVKVNAKISRLGINNYDYRNIVTNADLSERMFNGQISVNDSNLVFNADGKVDLRDNKSIFDIDAHLERANLKPLNLEFSLNETTVKTDFYLDFTGLTIDDIEGNASFVNTYLIYNGTKEVYIDSLMVESKREGNKRTFIVESDLASAMASGNFTFTQLARDLQSNFEEYKLNLENNSQVLDNYYRFKKNQPIPDKYQIDFNVSLRDINSILSIYVPSLYVSKGIFMTGDYTSGYTSIFNIHTNIDTLLYKDNEIYKTEVELSTSKIADSVNTLAMLYISSEEQKIKSFPATEQFYFEGIWNNRMIDFQTKLGQKGSTNNAILMGNFAFLKDRKKLSLHNSNLQLLNQVWTIADHNNITFAKEEINFENFSIAHLNQAISIDGTISNDRNKESFVKVDNFQIENINPLLSKTKLKGILNGTILVRDLYKDIDLEGNLLIDDFTIDNFLVGDIKGFSEYNETNQVLEVNVGVERNDNKIIDLSGYVKAADQNHQEELNLTATLDEANLEILNPILDGFLSNISGTATGELKITGSIDNLALKGIGDVKNGRFKVDYLGTTYSFEDKIYLDDNLIGFKKLYLTDNNNNVAIVNGGLYHDGFKNWVVDLTGSMKDFNILNTRDSDNNLFYGVANVTGDFEILGAFTDLSIKANATSNKGTKIFIPLNSTESLEQRSFIKFKKLGNLKDSIEKDHLDLSGIRLDLNLNITPDAYAEIIFDKRAGDIIRGYGEGNLKLLIDTRGDFSMFGNYKMVEGFYNFTLAGLINKEFKINPNSTISWSGDPYEGILNMSASYTQFCSLSPILTDMTTEEIKKNSELSRKYPVNVLLDLEGKLLSPKISLDIDILRNPPSISTQVLAFETNVKANEQELNKQVFSVLVLGALSREGSFTGLSSSGNNLSEFLSNQLSNWLSQVDENLEIDVNLNSIDRNALNTFQLRMSYSFLEGRLRVTRESGTQNISNTNNLANIAGEWTIEYLLSKDGNLRAKIYNRANQNMILSNAGFNATNPTAGFSLLHTQGFNSFKELFQFNKKKKSEELPFFEEEPSDTTAPDGPVNFNSSKQKKSPVN